MSLNEKIDNLSSLVVNKYVEEGVPLDETISKIAESEKFNENHIARLVETSNKKTFLKLFPEKHSFEVASVEGVKGRLKQSTEERSCVSGKDKQASAVSANEVNYKLLNLFKEENTKEASVPHQLHNTRLTTLYKGKIKRAIEELDFELRRKRAEMLNCENKLVELTKQAVLRGSSFADLETYSLSTLDGEKRALEVLDRVHSRVKDMPYVEKRASERGHCIDNYIGESNIYTGMIEKIIKNAYEDIPVIERGIEILKEKLAKMEEAHG